MTLTIYVETTSNRIVSFPSLAPSAYLELLRADINTLKVVFLDGGAQIELSGSPTGEFALKESPGGSAIAYSDTWTMTGAGATAVYTFELPLNGAALGTLLDASLDFIKYVDLLGAVKYGTEQTVPTIFRVYDAVFTGTEVSPSPEIGESLNLTSHTGGGSTSLDGISISGYTVGQLLWVRVGSGLDAQVDLFSLEAGNYTENENPLLGPIIINVDSDPTSFSWIQKA